MPLNELLRKEWKAAGYERGHGSDAVLPPAPTGFKRLYYLTAPEFALSNIVFGRLKISRFSELNDPFELLGQKFDDKEITKLIREHKDEFNMSNGIICFSADWTDPVLWSHYALKHKGVALGFDVSIDLVSEVRYSTSRIKLRMPPNAKSITPKIANGLIYTKFDSWKYEKEWRLLQSLNVATSEGGLFFLSFSKHLKLTEVILGPLCDLNLPKIRSLVNQNHQGVMTYKARLADNSFRILPSGKSVIQPGGQQA